MNPDLYQQLLCEFTQISNDYSSMDTFAIDRWGYMAQANLLMSFPQDIFTIYKIIKALYLHGVYRGIAIASNQQEKEAAAISSSNRQKNESSNPED